ncbi:hypothetical protein [Actinocrispum wychmicini]|uniref:Uncharacterized protein n=1 Tax=Actinocrispum wychmicini TaxID=1213861 RepID=A0A4R2JFF0_9PSEU|nr:hypothetical protein [Actinocrispum wychmicini]TCO58463.1 hypothetical protein EV192_105532 [Actinocrispum wychmicini]
MKPLHAIVTALLAGGAVGALAAWLVVVPVPWAVVIALPVTACTLLALLMLGVAAPIWQALPAPDDSLTVHQASALSSRLAEAARDQRRFQLRVQPRLGQLALTALRQRPGLGDLTTLTDQRAEQALGHELHTLLTDPEATLPAPPRLAELLRRLEEI